MCSPIEHISISIHALREEGDIGVRIGRVCILISIHALREEGDMIHFIRCTSAIISIHALREEGDLSPNSRGAICGIFLSTPSARRAT